MIPPQPPFSPHPHTAQSHNKLHKTTLPTCTQMPLHPVIHDDDDDDDEDAIVEATGSSEPHRDMT